MLFDSLFRFLNRRARPHARSRPRARVVPTLETLEERWVPSVADGTMSLQSLAGDTPIAASGPGQVSTTNTPTIQTQSVSASFAPFQTGGSATQTVAQFDPSLGALNGIQILINGKLTSNIQIENLDGAPSDVSAQVHGTLILQGPGFTPQSLSPSINDSATLGAYDGTLDYGGTSGKDFGAQSAQANQTLNLAAATNDLSAWVGKGTVSLTEAARSASTVSGSGNEQVHIGSQASGTVQVVYSYIPTPTVPPNSPPPVSPPGGCGNPPPNSPPPISPPPVSPPTTCTPPDGPASIGGIVYIDHGNQNHYVPDDPGVPGVTVHLTGTTVTGQSVNLTTTTGTDGAYNFTNLQAGLYTLSDDQPAGYTRGAETVGSLGGAVVGDTMVVAIPAGADGMCYDFGEDPPLPPPPPPPPPPAPPPPPGNNGNPLPPPTVTPSTPTPGGSTTPTPSTPPFDPPLPWFFAPGALSKRSLLGDGWQSLG